MSAANFKVVLIGLALLAPIGLVLAGKNGDSSSSQVGVITEDSSRNGELWKECEDHLQFYNKPGSLNAVPQALSAACDVCCHKKAGEDGKEVINSIGSHADCFCLFIDK